ncbi:MAG TPA: hypothetical protein VJS44_05605 [Pyrinomonadaceae bacterium]|nr:hypothetical protein [Pyrinomonadaceae bacterium]
MRRHLHLVWGLFYRSLKFLERKYPRTFPGSPRGRVLSGDEQLRIIQESLDKSLRLKGVQIVPFDETCESCHAASNKFYSLEERPPIPLQNCPRGKECTAIYAPVIDYGLYKVSQIMAAKPDIKVQELRRLLREEAEPSAEALDKQA